MWWQAVEDVAANLFAWLISEKGGDVVGFSVVLVICIVSVIRWHHRQRAAKKLGMASWYFIAICFVVAVAATGAGVYGLALRETGPQAKVEPPPNPLAQPPRPARSKEMIGELLHEAGQLLIFVQKAATLQHEWRNSLAGKRPERVCLDLDSQSLQDEASNLAIRLHAINKEIIEFLENNRIDRSDLTSLLGGYRASLMEGGNPVLGAASSLDGIYVPALSRLGNHPTCEEVIKSEISSQYYNMTGNLNALSAWIEQSLDRIKNFQDALRKEARNAP